MSVESSSEVRLAREMGLLDITMIGVGAMIGAGIFVLTGIAAGVAGPALILVFALNGFVTLFAASAYAELGSSFHDAGGGYLWVKTGLKDPQGFMSGWMSWFAHAVACSLYALGFGAYFHMTLKMAGIHNFQLPFMTLDKWLAVFVVAVFAVINYRGASETGKAGNIITISKIVIILVFIVFGVWITLHRPDWQARFTDFLPKGMGGVFMAMGLTFIAFEGYEIIAQCSEEVREPKKNVPRAVFLSLLIVIPIYLLVAFAALGAVTVHGMPSWQFLGMKKELALVEAASHFFPYGGIIILVGGLLSTISALNATIYSSSRVSFAMGRDRNLPSWFGRVHNRRKTPHLAIAASSVLIAFMAVALPIEAVASASDIMFLLLFMQVLVVVWRLRKKRPDLDRGFKVPWVPVVPIVGILLQAFLAVYLMFYSPRAWISAAVWIGIGLVVFYAYSRKRDRAYARVVATREAAARKDYRILACIADPRGAEAILKIADTVARHFNGEVLGLSVVEVPEGERLPKGLDHVPEIQDVLENVLNKYLTMETPRRALVKVSHRVSFAVTETVLEEQCNLVIIGRARRTNLMNRIFTTAVDRVVRATPAQVLVVSAERWPGDVRRILMPYDPGVNSELAADLAAAFGRRFESSVRAVRVVPRDATTGERAEAEADLKGKIAGRFAEGESKVIMADEIIPVLLRESRQSDLVVLGGSGAGILEQLLGYSVPLELSERTSKPVIVVYEMAAEPKRWLA
ncbi:MAG: amino acid permease [Acidobacteriota bacterium]|jgi:basic amino acid/polyamine antiporter, APA family